MYLEFGKTNDNAKKILGIFSKYHNIRGVIIGTGRVLAVSENPSEEFSNDYPRGLQDGARSVIYCFYGNDLYEENLPVYAEFTSSL